MLVYKRVSQICKQRASTDDADGDGEISGDVETRAGAHDPRSFNTVYTRSYSYGHLLVITGYKWDYTFYKWG